MYSIQSNCRLCKTAPLEVLFDLGEQAFTGIFPKANDPDVSSAPLVLVKCPECHLVQLQHSFDPGDLYGATYGYRSGLNASMVLHLKSIVAKIEAAVPLQDTDLVIDIGSNDGTTLASYANKKLKRIGVDPSGSKFLQYYSAGTELIPDFFTADVVRRRLGNVTAKAITSIAMFYDLPDPQSFVDNVASLLDDQGIWFFEQSYLPKMLETNSYDTICHEHLEYYSLAPILRMLAHAGLKVIDLEFNDTNGGSFAVTAGKMANRLPEATTKVESTLNRERALGLTTRKPFDEFKGRVETHQKDLKKLFATLRQSGHTVWGYGASTKGNVCLQYCSLTREDLPCIVEVNPDKFGARTPGTNIPIVSETANEGVAPHFMLVLPWHFRAGIIKREAEYLKAGGTLLFALPNLEGVTQNATLLGVDAICAHVLGSSQLKTPKPVPVHAPQPTL